jgi:hypothetical protein
VYIPRCTETLCFSPTCNVPCAPTYCVLSWTSCNNFCILSRELLQLTSLLFATNAAHAFTKRHVFYAILLLFLTGSSIVWHSCDKFQPDSATLLWIDQIAIWSFVIMSVFYITRLSTSYLVPVLLVLMVVMGLAYYLGFVCTWKATYPLPHSILHMTTSVCSHLILLGL